MIEARLGKRFQAVLFAVHRVLAHVVFGMSQCERLLEWQGSERMSALTLIGGLSSPKPHRLYFGCCKHSAFVIY
mgnify:FL=1